MQCRHEPQRLPGLGNAGGTCGGVGSIYKSFSLLKELPSALSSQIESRAAVRLLVTSSFSLSSLSRLAVTASSSKKSHIVEVAKHGLSTSSANKPDFFLFSQSLDLSGELIRKNGNTPARGNKVEL